MNQAFILEQIFDVPVEKVWEALTTATKMKEWYFPQLTNFEPIVGYKFKFEDDDSTYKKEWTVTSIIPLQKLAHTWVYKGYPGVSEVTFELFKEGDRTRLRLTHTGLNLFPEEPHFARERFERGWATIISTSLKAFLQSDK